VKFFPSLKSAFGPHELKSVAGMLASADLHVLTTAQLRLVGGDLARRTVSGVISTKAIHQKPVEPDGADGAAVPADSPDPERHAD